MDMASTSSSQPSYPIPHFRLVQRLVQYGLSAEQLRYPAIVTFAAQNNTQIPDLVRAILPTDNEITFAGRNDTKHQFQDCMLCLQWLMFMGDPNVTLSEMVVEDHGLCGYLWGEDDLTYACRTCEIDLCVPCFQNGEHKDHNYALIRTQGGRCDCGDVNASKHDGFCTKHKGIKQSQPLQETIAQSVELILHTLFEIWKNKLEASEWNTTVRRNRLMANRKYATKLTSAIVSMLLAFCEKSERLLCFIALQIASSAPLLNLLIKAENCVRKTVAKQLYNLLFILLGEPSFKTRFADGFFEYYPMVVEKAIRWGHINCLKRCPFISTFSVEILTFPNVTLPHVKERGLLGNLFGYLADIFDVKASFATDGLWTLFFDDLVYHVIEDIRYVISLATVPQYVVNEQRALLWMWLRLSSFVQGMEPIKRNTGSNVAEYSEKLHAPYLLCDSIAQIHFLLVDEAFEVPEAVSWLACECLRAFEEWLGVYDPTSGRISAESQNRQHLVHINSNQYVDMTTRDSLSILILSEWPNITYDVSSEEISIHYPLHRLLFLLLHNVVRRCGGCLEPNGDLLWCCHPSGFSAFVMEHPLRVRVFCAQYAAGMWSANGSATSFSYNQYHDPTMSNGVEYDIFLLQVCAALAPSDCYIKRIMERFGLTNYLSLDLENSSEFEPALVQEMLKLIIQLLQERRFCGSTIAESVRREFIHKLSVKDMPLRKLVESLPSDLAKCDQIKEIIETVGYYSWPSSYEKGKYKLRRECWKELDLYHPRLELVEERYMQVCNASPYIMQLPRWTKICEPLERVAGIATCQPVLEMIRAVLFYSTNNSLRSSDETLVVALHLLCLAVDIWSQLRESGLLLDFVSQEIGDDFQNGAAGQSLLSLLVRLMSMHKEENLYSSSNSLIESLLKKFAEIDCSLTAKLQQLAPQLFTESEVDIASDIERRKAQAREKQASIMAKMKAQQSIFLSSIDCTEVDGGDSTVGSSHSKEALQILCSFCGESNSSDPVYYLIFLQKSRVLSFINRVRSSWDKEQVTIDENVSTSCKDWVAPLDCDGVFVSSCGHAAHPKCLNEYLSTREGDQREFACPLCRQVANSVVPGDFRTEWEESYTIMREESNSLMLSEAISHMQSTGATIDMGEASSFQRDVSDIGSLPRLLSTMYPENARVSPSILVWDTLKYSITSMEVVSRCAKEISIPTYTLSALYKELESPTGFVLSLLVKVVKNLQCQNRQVLQRLRGLQLFSESISGHGGNTLKNVEMDAPCLDGQFWERASDPVLIRDPFSSLMWVLLGHPNMSHEDTFLLLVRMFYAVCVAQAITVYCAKRQMEMGDSDYAFINGMCQVLRETEFAQKYFISNYVDPSSDLLDVIRKLSFPYLRRCALLWKLLSSSVPIPYSERDLVLHSPVIDTIDSDLTEMKGIQELEMVFKIPSISTVLKDDIFQSLALRWVEHFRKACKAYNFQSVFYSTPAVPFRLIKLPPVYDDLYIRYHKKQFCHACKNRISEPVICLLCGRLCSTNSTPCCSENSCESHAMSCNAGTGVFLLTESTRILLRRGELECRCPSPYLDENRDQHVYVEGGIPLLLNEERYASLAYLVASHGFYRCSEILGREIVWVEE